MRRKRQLLIMLIIVLMNSVIGSPHRTIHAAGVVGTGTPASCTEAALDAALAGGGTVRFSCGTGAVTIPITTMKVISSNTTLDGVGNITLRGNSATRLFAVNSGVTLSVVSVNLSNGGASSGGAILNNGNVLIFSSTISGNTANVGGAIFHDSPGSLLILNSNLSFNRANESGGAIHATPNSDFQIVGSTFVLNSVVNGFGSAIRGSGRIQNCTFGLNVAGGGGNVGVGTVATEGELNVIGSSFSSNVVNAMGGGIYVAPQATTVTIRDSQFTQNQAHGGGGGIYVGGDGSATVRISRSRFERNRGYVAGGGILINGGRNSGTYVTASQFIANHAIDTDNATNELGGGIGVMSGYLEIDQSTFSRNRSREGGGVGTRLTGTFRIIASTFDANAALSAGGGVFLDNLGDLDARNRLDWIENSTFYANQAPSGGGIFMAARRLSVLHLVYVTIAYNNDNGIKVDNADNNAEVRIRGSIIAHNTGTNCATVDPDIFPTFVPNTAGSLEFPGNTCGGVEFTGVNPLLGSLGDYGGGTNTIPLLPGSPAIDKIPPRPPAIYNDQRNIPRPQDGNGDGVSASDIGAFEVANPNDTGRTSSPVTENCQNFAAISPLDTLPDGMVMFIWKPTPGATGYRLNLYNAEHKLLNTYNLGAGVTSISLEMSQTSIGTGTTFFWQIQALRGQTVICSREVQLIRKETLPPAPTFQPPKP